MGWIIAIEVIIVSAVTWQLIFIIVIVVLISTIVAAFVITLIIAILMQQVNFIAIAIAIMEKLNGSAIAIVSKVISEIFLHCYFLTITLDFMNFHVLICHFPFPLECLIAW